MYRRRSSANRVRRPWAKRSRAPRRYVRKRRFTKRRIVRPRVSRRSLLNVTSRKKKDEMIQMSATLPDGSANTEFALGPTYTRARNSSGGQPLQPGGLYFWDATARAALTASDESSRLGPPVLYDEATRTATTCYMRGLSETIHVQTLSTRPWKWRRICITTHEVLFDIKSDPAIQPPYDGSLLTSDGYTRPWFNYNNVADDFGKAAEIYDLLFAGVLNSDWSDPMTAKVDTRRVKLHYDRVRVIKSGNDSGVMRTYKHWHPMNKNLVYNDEQFGGGQISSPVSVSNQGMGNYIVLDFFACHESGTADDVLRLDSQTCLYWHEK